MSRLRCRLPLLFAAASFMPVLHAQDAPTGGSSWLIGGSASIQRSRNVESEITSTSLDLNPQLGYFIATGLALTANLRFARSTTEGASSTAWGVGPGASYYFGRAPRTLYPYVSGRILWGRDRNTVSIPLPGGELTSSSTNWLWRVAGGGALMLVRNAAVTGELFFARNRRTSRGSEPVARSTDESYGLAVGLSIFAY